MRNQATSAPKTPHLSGISGLQLLSNGLELDVTCPLINGPNFAVPEHLLRNPLPHEAHATQPLYGLSGHAASYLRRVQLGHGGVGDKVLSGLLLAGGVVDQGTRGRNLGVCLRELKLHALESTNELAELLTIVPNVAVTR